MINKDPTTPFFYHDKKDDTYWLDIGWAADIGFNPEELKELCAEIENLLTLRKLTFLEE